jgi:hypothetical protein
MMTASVIDVAIIGYRDKNINEAIDAPSSAVDTPQDAFQPIYKPLDNAVLNLCKPPYGALECSFYPNNQ